MTGPRKPRKTYESEIVPENEVVRTKLPHARTPAARESQLVAITYDLAEKQILDGTASSQVMTHFLKIGSTREKIELEKLRHETKLLDAKIEGIQSMARVEELYKDAMDAMRGYSGQEVAEVDDPNTF